MLRDILSKRWFMGALGFFVLMVVGSLLYLKHIERQEAEKLACTEERLKKLTEKQKPTAEGDILQGGHFHEDGTFHAEPHAPVESPAFVAQPTDEVEAPLPAPHFDVALSKIDGFTINSTFAAAMPPAGVGPDWASMSSEELADAISAINSNPAHPPNDLWPPDGYDYLIKVADNKVRLDNNGYPVLHKRGEPVFRIIWTPRGFRPTPEQHAEYKALHKRYMELRAKTVSSPEIESIKAQKENMRQTYAGPVPDTIGGSAMTPVGTDLYTYYQRYEAVKKQLKRNTYKEAGLGYIVD